MDKIIINNHVRKLRFNSNEMTQNDLAEKVGVTRQTIVGIEKVNTHRHLNGQFDYR